LSLSHLGAGALDQGDYWTARALLRESLAICRELGGGLGIAQNLEWFAVVAAAQAQPERAARLLGAAEALREAKGALMQPADRARQERCIAAVRTALAEGEFVAAWAEGRAMSLPQAVQYALEESADC
jgi:hypothetical protein